MNMQRQQQRPAASPLLLLLVVLVAAASCASAFIVRTPLSKVGLFSWPRIWCYLV